MADDFGVAAQVHWKICRCKCSKTYGASEAAEEMANVGKLIYSFCTMILDRPDKSQSFKVLQCWHPSGLSR